jgi:hypothetical protein
MLKMQEVCTNLPSQKQQAKGTTPNKGGTQGGNLSNVGNKEFGFVVPMQIILRWRT